MSDLNRNILKLAIPSILANITTPLLGLVDTAIVGHLGDAIYIAAIGVGSVMFNMMYWLFDFLRAGTSGLSAQAFGAKDMHASTLVLLRSTLLGLSLGLLMILLQWPLFGFLCRILHPGETADMAHLYFSILIYGAPAALANYALSGWYLGRQRSQMLFYISLVINIVNIATSLTLVYLLHLGIRGIALGTLSAQWAGLIFGAAFIGRHHPVRVRLAEILRLDELKQFFSVNFDVMIRTACIIAVTVWFTRTGASQGALILAANTLLMQFFYIFSYLMDGFAFAGEALIGKFSGSHDDVSLARCVRYLLLWGVGCALLFSGLFTFGGETLLSWLSDDSDVLQKAGEYYLWAAAVPLAGFAAFVWDGVYIGAMLTRRMLWATFGATVVFFAVYAATYHTLSNHGLWLAFIIYLAARGIFQAILWKRHRHKA